ncbi:hypothetical protein BT93_G1171 [Corymbia citriodora subsp. variegata]|nr:hypothetical protein BT93_G1171 [Corymbia citriodora subsp. variegata]
MVRKDHFTLPHHLRGRGQNLKKKRETRWEWVASTVPPLFSLHRTPPFSSSSSSSSSSSWLHFPVAASASVAASPATTDQPQPSRQLAAGLPAGRHPLVAGQTAPEASRSFLPPPPFAATVNAFPPCSTRRRRRGSAKPLCRVRLPASHPRRPNQTSHLCFSLPLLYFGCNLPHRNRICCCFDGTVTQHRRQPPSAREPPRPASTPTEPAGRFPSLPTRSVLAETQPPGTAALRPSPSRLLLDRTSPGRDPFPQTMASTRQKRPCVRLTNVVPTLPPSRNGGLLR